MGTLPDCLVKGGQKSEEEGRGAERVWSEGEGQEGRMRGREGEEEGDTQVVGRERKEEEGEEEEGT